MPAKKKTTAKPKAAKKKVAKKKAKTKSASKKKAAQKKSAKPEAKARSAAKQVRNASASPAEPESLGEDTTKYGASSAFKETGFEAVIDLLEREIQELYTLDEVPWIIGYSGGKDSTAVLQLVWNAIEKLPAKHYRKPIHVISTDTLVENPIVAAWVSNSLAVMRREAEAKGLPFQPHRLTPAVEDSFWVNLMGKGYPAPRHKFRWCTERLKIKPSNTFITNIVKLGGEAILVLGTRKAESSRRAANMEKHEKQRVRDRLSPNSSLPGASVYTPVERWTNDDVWFYLMQCDNPWGYNNRDLLGMYAGASADGECPLVVDDTTPSCGDSRFGCWVCTLVEKDKSMTAMVQNDAEMEWMQPLLELRNLIDFRQDGEAKDRITGEMRDVHTKREAFESPVGEALGEFLMRVSGRPVEELVRDRDWERYLRDFRRLKTGNVQMMANGEREIRGPYIQEARECWLTALLTAQTAVRELGPDDVKNIELITLEELEEIRRIWVMDKHELEDRLPVIYREVTGEPYPGRPLDDNLVLGQEEMQELADICGEDSLHYQLSRELMGLTIQQRNSARRSGVYEQIEKALRRSFYEDEEDALKRARRMAAEKKEIEQPEPIQI